MESLFIGDLALYCSSNNWIWFGLVFIKNSDWSSILNLLLFGSDSILGINFNTGFGLDSISGINLSAGFCLDSNLFGFGNEKVGLSQGLNSCIPCRRGYGK